MISNTGNTGNCKERIINSRNEIVNKEVRGKFHLSVSLINAYSKAIENILFKKRIFIV